MEREELLRGKEIRCEFYQLLAQCYYLPDEELIETLKQSEEVAGWRRGGGENTWRVGDIDSLKVDYTRLFIGPYRLLAPPYGSVYMEKNRMVMGDSTMDAKQRYQEAGLNLTLKEAPDHVAIELEFMHFLIFKEIEALSNDDMNRGIDLLQKQKAFLQIHLGVWVAEFTRSVGDNAETDFYRRLAQATQRFVLDDLNLLSEESLLDSHKVSGAVSR